MIELDIGVVTNDDRDALQRGAIVTVVHLADLAGRRASQPSKLTKVIDIVRGEPTYRTFPFEDPGIYEVTMRSPGGVESRELTLQGSKKLALEVRPRRAAEAVERWDGMRREDFIRYGSALNAFDFLTTRVTAPPTFIDFADTKLLNSGAIEFDRTGGPAFVVPRFSKDAIIDAPAYSELNNIYFAIRGEHLDDAVPARWTSSFGRNGRDLVSIPWAWFPIIEEPNRTVQIKLRQSRADSGPTTVLEVLDTKWGALLEFVTQGRMEDASKIAESLMNEDHFGLPMSLPEFALQGKLQEPLVAVLGGIILVSNTVGVRTERWDHWLENLANWFPKVPDAAAIYGYRRLQMGDAETARHWLRQSVGAGFPFFSSIFRLLMLAFSQLEDQESLDIIGPAAAAVDVTQPFTVIHVPWGLATPNPPLRQAQR